MLLAWSHFLWLVFAVATAADFWLRTRRDPSPAWLRGLAGLTLALSALDGIAWALGDPSWQLLPALSGAALALARLTQRSPHPREDARLDRAQPEESEGEEEREDDIEPTPFAPPLATCLDGWPHAAAMADGDGLVVWCNAAWRERHGLDAGQAMDADWLELLPSPEARAQWQDLAERAEAEGRAEGPVERRGPAGPWKAQATLVSSTMAGSGLQWLTLSESGHDAFRLEIRRLGHDLNNLLSAIVGNVGLALDSPGLLPATQTDLREAETASMRAAEIIQRLQAMSRGNP